MNHKCNVFKFCGEEKYPWATQCQNEKCTMYHGYLTSDNWEEAMLEALHHKMRNK